VLSIGFAAAGAVCLVPFFCDVFVGEALQGMADQTIFMNELERQMLALAAEHSPPAGG
jgi:hypothetical protein